MSFVVSADIKGMRLLNRKLKRLDATMRGTVLDKAVKKGALIWRNEARRTAPRRKGAGAKNAWKQIHAKRQTPKSERGEKSEYAVSWRVGKASRTPAFYLLFAEKGTNQRTRKKVGGIFKGSKKKSTGKQSAKPFLIPAFDRKKGEADRVVKQSLLDAIAKVSRGR